MAFTLKKHTSNQLESARLNDVNQNWTDIETAIDALQTNASDGTIITDTDNSTSYRMQFRLVGGKPVIEYNQV